ncbi:MAG: NAD-dependent epimerase/dehydratase family protein [Pseudomonadota bacterium]
MKIFMTGVTGYIGGSVALALRSAGHDVHGLVRSEERAAEARSHGFVPIMGGLDDAGVLTSATQDADLVIHTAHADHAPSAHALLAALEGSGKRLIHTSGSSIVGTQAGGEFLAPVYDEATPFTPSPGRAPRVALNKDILGAKGLHPVIIAPSLIYGLGHIGHRHSMQVPWLVETARRKGVPSHLGPGENVWSHVHIDDVVKLFLLAIEKAPAGALYYAENGEASMKSLCQSIGRAMGKGEATQAMTLEEAAAEWGEGPAMNTMGSNSRVRSVRARDELGWSPQGTSVTDEIERGCYLEFIRA